jgi:hypothetical protein
MAARNLQFEWVKNPKRCARVRARALLVLGGFFAALPLPASKTVRDAA